jgi:hypothetical protein
MAMNKLNSSKVAQVLADAQRVLLSVSAERDKLASENFGMRRRMEAEKLAAVMHGKGLEVDTDFAELVQRLEKRADDGQLSIIKEAVDMVAPNMGLSVSLSSDDAPGSMGNSFESYILGNVG